MTSTDTARTAARAATHRPITFPDGLVWGSAAAAYQWAAPRSLKTTVPPRARCVVSPVQPGGTLRL
jgi:hypothetical protein